MTNSFPKDIKQRLIGHMNADHVDAMRDYCRYANIEIGKADPQMILIDQNGFNLDVNGRKVRFDFKETCTSPDEVRSAPVKLAETARKNL